jgi:hypothetical protein
LLHDIPVSGINSLLPLAKDSCPLSASPRQISKERRKSQEKVEHFVPGVIEFVIFSNSAIFW